MHHATKLLKQIVALAVGLPLLIIGLILIPVPGPGFLTCFVALYILSLGFEWPKKHLDRSKIALRGLYEKAKKRADAIERKNNEN